MVQIMLNILYSNYPKDMPELPMDQMISIAMGI